MAGINVEELDEQTKKRIGLEVKQPMDELGSRLIVLGKIFKSMKGLSNEGAIWVLKQAIVYCLEQSGAIPYTILEKIDIAPSNYVPPMGWTIQVVAEVFRMDISDLKRRGRNAEIALARQVAMYVLYKMNKYSLFKIGVALGGRSPATVSHGFQAVASRINSDALLRDKVAEIHARLLIE